MGVDMHLDFTVTFTHPKGPVAGLNAVVALEKVLKKSGCKPYDHGTNFSTRRAGGRRVNAYVSSDVTATADSIPMKVIRETLYGKLGIQKFGMVTRQPRIEWRVKYQIAPWPSRTRTITVLCATSCGARGLVLERLKRKYGPKNVRLLR